ncbi:ATP-binding cassette domain-containing protein [Labrys wisconsinensis]|uniref:ABC-type sugar transport system ATPase subunit n=1 Tax=Labrys wisconsinensis TaxID=425677 RepID=A0ABU0JBY4_9HYPH|nr:ATP-binding cassette domain-containing protein [Labrys wisconsinensis]MDQ0470657.1 ABC-type sugar transport system ATPase subunit [Labrys wisconsinensis]
MITLDVRGVAKRYGATRALDGLDLGIAAGEIVGIAGPNGAGKSTLMRMLAGEEMPDSGTIRLVRDGREAAEPWRSVAVVHQEPQLWPNMTVRENLAVGREARALGRMEAARDVGPTLAALGIAAYADYALADLSLAVQQRVEIARAILCEADVFLFDEPNSALTEAESRALFATMRELADSGRIVILITHRLSDFVRCCRRVLILRDGRIRGEIAGSVTEAGIAAELTIGLASAQACEPAPGPAAPAAVTPALSLRGLGDPGGLFRDVSLDLPAGAVTVLAGVEGSGARELAQAIGGFRRSVGVLAGPGGGKPRPAYLAASRRQTVFHNLSVGDSLAARLGWRRLSAPFPLLDHGRIAEIAARGIARYTIKAGSPDHPITSLSGGNQQKVVLGAAIEEDPDILVVEEPTRGVDVASKRDIYALLRAFARGGRAVVLFCTEVPEMHEVADAVIVLARGDIAGRAVPGEAESLAALAAEIATLEAS